MKVPFLDLANTTNLVEADYLKEVGQFLDRGQFILSSEVEQFEKLWAAYVGTRYCVGVSSGADALYLALLACRLQAGDEVIIQGNAYNACVTAIMRLGAVPRFVDIDSGSLTLAPEKIEHLINKNTKAIMPVHLYGQASSMDKIVAAAKKFNLKIVEDCAQAHGAMFYNRRVGTFGDAAAFSFYPTKNLGAFGDAGAVMLNDEALYQELLARRNLGQTRKNEHKYFGLNMRLDPIQAIALTLKLKTFKQLTAERIAAGQYYDRLFKEAGVKLNVLKNPAGATNVYHLYVIWGYGMKREQLQKKLKEKGIETAVHYPVPVYNQPFFQGKKDPCPETDRVLADIVSLPMFYGITRKQQEYVVESVGSILPR